MRHMLWMLGARARTIGVAAVFATLASVASAGCIFDQADSRNDECKSTVTIRALQDGTCSFTATDGPFRVPKGKKPMLRWTFAQTQYLYAPFDGVTLTSKTASSYEPEEDVVIGAADTQNPQTFEKRARNKRVQTLAVSIAILAPQSAVCTGVFDIELGGPESTTAR